MKTTRVKEKGMMRQQRNEVKGGMGGIFCPLCALFFDDSSRPNVASYKECEQHEKLGLNGYRLVDL